MKKLKGILIKLFIMAIIAFIILIIIISENTGERIQYLNNLDYNVVFDETGNMHVTETWDIYIENTNTLFKTFNLSKTKFGNIVNPKVVDLETGEELTQIHEEMYHVTEDCYYGLEINSHQYEIAWGVGLDNGSDTIFYKLDLRKINVEKIKRGTGSSWTNDIYVMAYPSQNVYYIKGVIANDNIYLDYCTEHQERRRQEAVCTLAERRGRAEYRRQHQGRCRCIFRLCSRRRTEDL